MEDSRAACHDRCVFCVVVFGFGPFFRYVAPTVLRVSITDPARIAISAAYTPPSLAIDGTTDSPIIVRRYGVGGLAGYAR